MKMLWQQSKTKRLPGRRKEREKIEEDEKGKEEIDKAQTRTSKKMIKLLGQ